MSVGRAGSEAVFLGAWKINDFRKSSVVGRLTRTAAHDVGVDINGIYRVAHRHNVVDAENVADVAAVALCAVAYEYFVGRDVDASCLEIVFGNGL